MSSTTSRIVCRKCHLPLAPDEAIELVNVRSGRVSYLCRPSSVHQCFANDVFSRDEERIRAVDDDDRGGAA